MMKKTGMSVRIGIVALAGVFVVWGVLSLRPKSLKETRVICETTKGQLEIVVVPEWAPRGVERFLRLVDDGFYTNLPLFRCIDHFICQFGSKPPTPDAPHYSAILDDPLNPSLREFKPGYLSFAGFGPNSRSTHIFIAFAAVNSLGTQPWETPFGYVTENSMRSTAHHFSTTYGESAPIGKGPEPQKIEGLDGAQYLKEFPLLDHFLSCARKP